LNLHPRIHPTTIVIIEWQYNKTTNLGKNTINHRPTRALTQKIKENKTKIKPQYPNSTSRKPLSEERVVKVTQNWRN
jgi:hypothetical protein